MEGTNMWFDICCAALLLVAGFVTIFIGAMGIKIIVDLFPIAPEISIMAIFGIIGIVTAGILMISGALRMAQEIKKKYIS